ncbi:hypothetical protein [Nostoc sp. C052]|nr:hypothetical protein [Nostoc sp. C052]
METKKEVRRCCCGQPQSLSVNDAGDLGGYTNRKNAKYNKEQRV